jgi:hypothetical protein
MFFKVFFLRVFLLFLWRIRIFCNSLLNLFQHHLKLIFCYNLLIFSHQLSSFAYLTSSNTLPINRFSVNEILLFEWNSIEIFIFLQILNCLSTVIDFLKLSQSSPILHFLKFVNISNNGITNQFPICIIPWPLT